MGDRWSTIGTLTKIYLGLIAFSIAGCWFSTSRHLDTGPIGPVASALTLAVGAAASFNAFTQAFRKRSVAAMAILLALGAAVELIGTHTGIPFGGYHYTDRWIPVIDVQGQSFPLLVPFAWLLMVGSTVFSIHGFWQQGPLWIMPLAALLAAAFDFAMEPVMTHRLKYWRWSPPGPLPGDAPIENFAGWFITVLLAAFILRWVGGLNVPRRIDAAVVLAGYAALLVALAVLNP